ncbi:MAG: hypothetical protein HQL95_12250 [Magnetococcales bacterium]|nr:hypothetical protein [Magnetococcales bacterium]
MNGVQQNWSQADCLSGILTRETDSAADSRSCPLSEGQEETSAISGLSPLTLDTVLTVEDLRRLMKIVAYS